MRFKPPAIEVEVTPEPGLVWIEVTLPDFKATLRAAVDPQVADEIGKAMREAAKISRSKKRGAEAKALAKRLLPTKGRR